MADKDILLVQEQAVGAPKQFVVTPIADSFLKFDESEDLVAVQIPLATQAEMEAGTLDAARIMTPLGVRQAVEAVLAEGIVIDGGQL